MACVCVAGDMTQILLKPDGVYIVDSAQRQHKASAEELTQYADQIAALKADNAKAEDTWVSIMEQLDQYPAHHDDATNKIAQVTDAKTQAALTKSLRALDDCHDALIKLIRAMKKQAKD